MNNNTHAISTQLEEQAQKGVAAAQYQLALAYFEKKSETLAVFYFNQAAQKGVAEAMYYMGVCYELGFGVIESKERALFFFEKAAVMGVKEAIAAYNRLKALVPEDPIENSDFSQEYGDETVDESEEFFYKAEDYYYGQNGQDVDYEEAVKWYEKAAELNHADAQFSLGYCYSHGQGVEEDDEQAVRWYQKGAENGSADAQSALGECYYNGEGVSEDAEKAFYWFNKAAEQDNATACFYMGECYENGYGCSVDLNLARQYYQKAHELGDEYAEDALAELDKQMGEFS